MRALGRSVDTFLVPALVATVTLAAPVGAKTGTGEFGPLQKLIFADVVTTGRVTVIENDPVEASPAPGVADKVAYRIAVIKVANGLIGTGTATHLKVGFVPSPPPDPVAPASPRKDSAVGTEGLFYLTRHHSGAFYVVHFMMPPVEVSAGGYQKHVDYAKRVAAVLADPVAQLKTESAADRAFAATVLIEKYGSGPLGSATSVEKVSAAESRLILNALTERRWAVDPNDPDHLDLYRSFARLQLTEADGWTPPAVRPGEDFVERSREAFVAWTAGAGRNYRLNKLVAKPK